MLSVTHNLTPKVALWPGLLNATGQDKPPGSEPGHTAGLGNHSLLPLGLLSEASPSLSVPRSPKSGMLGSRRDKSQNRNVHYLLAP